MAPPVLGYRTYIDVYFDDKSLLVPKRSRRRHNREVKIRSRMRFAQERMWAFQPGVKYGSLADINEPGKMVYPPWFVPGRFAKIHPMRVCSCEMCKGPHDWSKRERRKVRMDLKRLGEDYIDTERTSDW